MSVELIERAAAALGEELLSEVAFLGAAALPVWITDEAAPAPRATRDVDVIVEVGSLVAYYRLGDALGVGPLLTCLPEAGETSFYPPKRWSADWTPRNPVHSKRPPPLLGRLVGDHAAQRGAAGK
ncbi:MAG TPA: hypothetical protein VJ986_05040 [Gaiellaceae bacterium]|nr:hypothetical protein [Gaiellaceae bacterium]